MRARSRGGARVDSNLIVLLEIWRHFEFAVWELVRFFVRVKTHSEYELVNMCGFKVNKYLFNIVQFFFCIIYS